MKIQIETYKGFNIQRSTKIEDVKIADHSGKILNEVTPYYYIGVESTKKWYNTVGCYTSLEANNLSNSIAYIKNGIDKHLETQKEYKLERIKNRMESRHATYICNNVTIRAMFDAGIGGDYTQRNTQIYVNEQPLRNTYLNADFTFNDVLEQVYYNTIAKHNISKYSSEYTKKNYFKNHTTETIDIGIIPIYTFLGNKVKFNEIEFEPVNVLRDRYENKGFTFKVLQGEDVFVPLEAVKTLLMVGEATNIVVRLQALMKLFQFIE